ncbi:hypothetical protein ACJMK2_027081 [Sinanodonta woodiana]|uniref:Uncharacterized protein n=1 Tax=Sinanodonta woodiana TaxID=1069815 RepID=A0ABD3XM14_SINWO
MEKSTNRMHAFIHWQEEASVDITKVCKHGSTRWLSLGKTTKWVLKQWDPLTAFFKTECEEEKSASKEVNAIQNVEASHSRKQRVLENLRSRTFKLNLLFLDFIIPFFDRVNLKLQSEQPMIHKQAAQLKSLSSRL